VAEPSRFPVKTELYFEKTEERKKNEESLIVSHHGRGGHVESRAEAMRSVFEHLPP